MTLGLCNSLVTENQSVICLNGVFRLLIIHTGRARQPLNSINLIFLFKLRNVSRMEDKKYLKRNHSRR